MIILCKWVPENLGVIWGDSENLGSKPARKTEGVDGREGVVIVAYY